MRTLILVALLFPLLATAQTEAIGARAPDQAERIPAHTPEWTNPNTGDPGTTDSVIPELQKIVVLCATEPTSPNFKGQWIAYVRKNYEPGQNIDGVIDDVLRRANAYRTENARKGRARQRANADAATRKMMHDSAMSAIRNMK
jgi:hypothetical protein